MPVAPAPAAPTVTWAPSTRDDSPEEASLPGSVPAAAPEKARSLKDIDLQVMASLDKFFDNEDSWQRVAFEVSRTMRLRAPLRLMNAPIVPGQSIRFRVQVPKPYPGVQYRRTKDLNDKEPRRYARHNSTIVGEVEEDREWVRVRGSLYLPLRLGPVQILQPLHESQGESNGIGSSAGSEASKTSATSPKWWPCSPDGGDQPLTVSPVGAAAPMPAGAAHADTASRRP